MEITEIYTKLVNGIRTFVQQAHAGKVVIGLSGGIDSALVACLAIDALGKENVHAFLMPGPYSTVHSLTDALRLCELEGISNNVVPIDSIFNKYLRELAPAFEHTTHDVTEENLQARIRGVLLMAYSNKKNALVLNTSNKSELAMGYGTLYGDLIGSLMVIGDIYKTQVYELAQYLNATTERIPWHTIEKAPSAELHVGQLDSDSLPPYPILDPILVSILEEHKSRANLLDVGTPGNCVDLVFKRLNDNQFKALQVPPLLQVTDHPLLHRSKCIDCR